MPGRLTLVEELTARYLRTVDNALPGFVEMLYVTGSAALGAYQAGHSDVDTLIVTSRSPTDDDLRVLAGVHTGMPRRPPFDGVYLDRNGLAAQPAASEDVISKSRAGAYLAELFPGWATLADRAVRWRAGERVEFVATDLRDAATLVDDVIADAWRRWG